MPCVRRSEKKDGKLEEMYTSTILNNKVISLGN
jgi:hypothetical protein